MPSDGAPSHSTTSVSSETTASTSSPPPTSTSEVHTTSTKSSTTSQVTTSSTSHTTSSSAEKTTSHTSTHTSSTQTSASTSSSEHKSSTSASTSSTSTDSATSSTTSSSISTSTGTSTTSTGLLLPTTQSVTSTPTIPTDTTSYSISTDPFGNAQTITQIVASPSQSSKPGGFIHNSGAVAGVSVIVGIVGAAILVFGFMYIRRRRSRQRDAEFDFADMSYSGRTGAVTAGAGDYYASSAGHGSHGNANRASDFDMEPIDHSRLRTHSAGSLHQEPLAPIDATRLSGAGPYMADGGYDRASVNHPYNPYSSYAQNVVGAPTDYAGYDNGNQGGGNNGWDNQASASNSGYGQAGRYQISENYSTDRYGAGARGHHEQQRPDSHAADGLGVGMFLGEDDDPFDDGAHAQHGQGPKPSRGGHGVSYKSDNMTFGNPAGDDDYFDGHGPTNDDDSIVLGRPSVGVDRPSVEQNRRYVR